MWITSSAIVHFIPRGAEPVGPWQVVEHDLRSGSVSHRLTLEHLLNITGFAGNLYPSPDGRCFVWIGTKAPDSKYRYYASTISGTWLRTWGPLPFGPILWFGDNKRFAQFFVGGARSTTWQFEVRDYRTSKLLKSGTLPLDSVISSVSLPRGCIDPEGTLKVPTYESLVARPMHDVTFRCLDLMKEHMRSHTSTIRAAKGATVVAFGYSPDRRMIAWTLAFEKPPSGGFATHLKRGEFAYGGDAYQAVGISTERKPYISIVGFAFVKCGATDQRSA